MGSKLFLPLLLLPQEGKMASFYFIPGTCREFAYTYRTVYTLPQCLRVSILTFVLHCTKHIKILFLGSYGTIEFTLVYDEANELLVLNGLKAKVRDTLIPILFRSFCNQYFFPLENPWYGHQRLLRLLLQDHSDPSFWNGIQYWIFQLPLNTAN